MQITRTETPTGGPNRTPREEITELNTGTREVEPEGYLDFSESEGWPWESDPARNTWNIQIEAVRQFIVPFEDLDSQAKAEQAGGDEDKGGVYFYPFSNRFLPIGDGDGGRPALPGRVPRGPARRAPGSCPGCVHRRCAARREPVPLLPGAGHS